MIELPYINPNLYLDRNVAIIGSSGALLGSSLGKTIDTFKEVVRFNRAPTNGFENDVGSKTTLRVVNNHVFDNIDITKAGFSNSPANFVRDLRNCKILYVGPDAVRGTEDTKTPILQTSYFCSTIDQCTMSKKLLGVPSSKIY